MLSACATRTPRSRRCYDSESECVKCLMRKSDCARILVELRRQFRLLKRLRGGESELGRSRGGGGLWMRSPQRTKGGGRERGSVIMRCFACPAFLASLRSGSLARASRHARRHVRRAGRPGMRRGRGSICQPRKERDSRPLCPAMAAAAANYNFAWRRGSARGCVTELRATRGETRRREEKKEADGRTA